jgi:FtsZ-binding cell division protein ZapB
VAAAARPSEYGAVLKAAQAKLGALGEQCGDLPNLERDFEDFSAEVDRVRSLLGRMGNALPRSMTQLREALAEQAQDLKDDTDNFREYLSRQDDMPPSKYLIGRKDMGKELRQTIKSVHDFLARSHDPFSGPSSLRHSARGPIVIPVHDTDLAPDAVQGTADSY